MTKPEEQASERQKREALNAASVNKDFVRYVCLCCVCVCVCVCVLRECVCVCMW